MWSMDWRWKIGVGNLVRRLSVIDPDDYDQEIKGKGLFYLSHVLAIESVELSD